jgi:KUP system potassium uptake protein
VNQLGQVRCHEQQIDRQQSAGAETEGQIAIDDASYFLSKLELRAGSAPTMAAWRKRLFVATSYIAADAAEYFGLPSDRTVVMGARIDV